jgi:chorismate mutase
VEKLAKYRKKVDKINIKILKLLAKRLKITKKIGEYKKANNIKIFNSNREKEIYQTLEKQAEKYNLDKHYVKKVFKIIIKHSRKNQI